ncbi:hypothetical protein ACPW96_14150 [Micromonospora sp. DT81.3]|uniref:hypothetical protein n=1 Tax=Micromonospora sp. DT81.3 TaxID=3416523 RepID=UPI003CF19F99
MNDDEVDDKISDRVTLGPSVSNKDVLDLLVRQGMFRTALGAFQAAAMLAIRRGLDPATAQGSAGTMWNRGSVTPQVLEFLEWYLPTKTPVRMLEQLGNLGTAHVADRVRSGGYTLTELFELPELEIDQP